MRLVIVGAGRVGIRTARALEDSGHEVVLVERDESAVSRARGEGFEIVEGNGSREEIQKRAGVETADALGALTSDLNTNFAACMIANQHDCWTVMRIDEDYREEIYRQYADEVDEVVYPERLGAIVAKNALLGGNIRAIADVANNLQLVEFTVTDTSPVRGYSLSELELPGESRLLAFGKADEPMRVPTPDQSLELDDRLVVLTAFEKLEDVRSLVVGTTDHASAEGD